MNRTVGQGSVGGFRLRIKTVQNNTFLYEFVTFDPTTYYINNTSGYVKFTFRDEKNVLKLGQFYKVQLAYQYIDNNKKTLYLNDYYSGRDTLEKYIEHMEKDSEQGSYSSTSVIKFTSWPLLEIDNLRSRFLNAYTNSFTGIYSQKDTEVQVVDENNDPIYIIDESGARVPKFITYKRDATEKVYNYKFDLYDAHDNLIHTSGEIIHNNSTDTDMQFSQDKYFLNADIPIDEIYYIQYTITTINGLIVSTPRYKMVKRTSINAELQIEIDAMPCFNNGYIDIQVRNDRDSQGLPTPVTGSFLLLRTDEESNYNEWQELYRFKLANERLPDGSLYKDLTVEQGKHYKYAIQQYNSNDLFSNKIESNIVYADFEDAFLFDGVRQLKIKYNPKMSKFSNTRLESKVETIGSQYPFILRNGQVNYHEFNLSGLLSFLSDDEFLFLSKEELKIIDDPHRHSTPDAYSFADEDPTSVNIARERLFKMKVLEWLNDGKPKVFRSPTEGNFIVRLMKISLAPQDKLGRMLHTFNSTAYEIADFSYTNLCGLAFINPEEPNNKFVNWVTLKLRDVVPERGLQTINIDPNTKETIRNVQTVRFTGLTPGEQIELIFTNGNKEILFIGPSGNLLIDKVTPIDSIRILPKFQKVISFNDLDYFAGEYYIRYLDQYIKYPLDKDDNNEPTIIPDKTYRNTFYKRVNKSPEGYMTFSHFIEQTPTFNSVSNVHIQDSMIRQFIGAHNILQEISQIDINNSNNYQKNPKVDILNYYYIKVTRRPKESVAVINNMGYHVLTGTSNENDITTFMPIQFNLKHPFTVYECVYFKNSGGYELGKCFDNTPTAHWDYEPFVSINNERIYIDRDIEISLKDFNNITELSCGSGVVVELGYLIRQNEYYIEQTHNELKGQYQEILDNFNDTLNYSDFISNYNSYCVKLYNILNQ